MYQKSFEVMYTFYITLKYSKTVTFIFLTSIIRHTELKKNMYFCCKLSRFFSRMKTQAMHFYHESALNAVVKKFFVQSRYLCAMIDTLHDQIIPVVVCCILKSNANAIQTCLSDVYQVADLPSCDRKDSIATNPFRSL